MKKNGLGVLVCLLAFHIIIHSTAMASLRGEGSSGNAIGKGKKEVDGAEKARMHEAYGKLPLYFIQNKGQVDKRVKFYEKGSGHATFFTEEGVYLSLTKSIAPAFSEEEPVKQDKAVKPQAEKVQLEVVRLTTVGGNKKTAIIAEGMHGGKVNYLIGKDPKKWKRNIPTYGSVIYKEVYKGIDMKFYGNNRQLEYDIIVNPGSDPSILKLSYEGIKGLKIADNGDLIIDLNDGSIIQKSPVIYQEIDGERVDVAGRFVIPPKSKEEKGYSYGFHVASYDKNRPLIIDPILVYSTYLGGSGDDEGLGIAVDASGNAYVTGYTTSIDFPTAFPIQGFLAGWAKAFVTKFDSTGSSLVYSTYLGGTSYDMATDIAVDAAGNAYITGHTYSSDFPIVSPIQGTIGGDSDVFVAKIDPTGSSLVYSTYLGGSGQDGWYSWDKWTKIAVDVAGNAYVTGMTGSTDFPTANPVQGDGGYMDAFVTKINASGNGFVYSTYLGGTGVDFGNGIAADATGNTYVTGYSSSNDFPMMNPIQASYAGNIDAFVTKINPTGNSLVYSTYLGGSGYDYGNDIAVDAQGNAYITGVGWSSDFPTVNPIPVPPGVPVVGPFVTKIDSTGGSIVYSTRMEGWRGMGIAVDAAGNAYVASYTYHQPVSGLDTIVTKIAPAGSSYAYKEYIAGSLMDRSSGIAVDNFGNAYVTGYTYSNDFPTVNPIQGSLGGYRDAFVTKISDIFQLANFTAEAEIELGPLAYDDEFEVKGTVTLGAGSDGINPLTEDVLLKVGTFAITIPAGSFVLDEDGEYEFEGVVNGVDIEVKIVPLGGGSFKFEAEGEGAELTGTVAPVTVGLTIGNDSGSTTAVTELE